MIPLLEKLIEKTPEWKSVPNKFSATLRWMHPNLPNEEVMEWLNYGDKKICNRYPDIKVLAHKDTFANAMKICMEMDPDNFDFIPPTFRLPSSIDSQRFLEYRERNKNATYIAKP